MLAFSIRNQDDVVLNELIHFSMLKFANPQLWYSEINEKKIYGRIIRILIHLSSSYHAKAVFAGCANLLFMRDIAPDLRILSLARRGNWNTNGCSNVYSFIEFGHLCLLDNILKKLFVSCLTIFQKVQILDRLIEPDVYE